MERGGQESRQPAPPSPALNLEYAAPAPGMTAMPPQGVGSQPVGSSQSVAELANPFDGGTTPVRCRTRVPRQDEVRSHSDRFGTGLGPPVDPQPEGREPGS